MQGAEAALRAALDVDLSDAEPESSDGLSGQWLRRVVLIESVPSLREQDGFGAIGQQTVVADAHEALRQQCKRKRRMNLVVSKAITFRRLPWA
ncbi:MAG: hypothetical protein ABI812_08500 [Betaproteobacteria bacterium]